MARFWKNSHTWVVAAVVMLSGCRSFNLPSWSWLDKLGVQPVEPVPEEVLSRHGPTFEQRIERIETMGKEAAGSSSVQQQQIADALAQHIQGEKDPLVRARVVNAISKCRVQVAAAVMRAALKDDDLDVQRAACRAWGRWGGPEAVQLMGQVVADGKEPLDVRLAAVAALQRIKDPSSAAALATALEQRQDPAMQYRAVEALQEITGLEYGNDLVAWRNHFAQSPAYLAAEQPMGSPPFQAPNNSGAVAPVDFQR